MILAEVLEVALQVGGRLDRLGVTWAIGGSFASSVLGVPRSTQDVDFVAAVEQRHVAPLVAAFETDHYVSEEAVRSAVLRRASFNLIHLASITKIDVFVPKGDDLSQRQLTRRRLVDVAPGRSLSVLTPEDVVLQKLRWFRASGEVAEQQLRDVQGVLATSGSEIDFEDLERAARLAGLEDLLARVRAR
jgi:hypothetical protein